MPDEASLSARIPPQFRADVVRRIGHGGEATVFELVGGRALRLYHRPPHDSGGLAAFYRSMPRDITSFALPEVLEQGDADGQEYSIDRLIPGRPLHDLMPGLRGADRARALSAYTDAAYELAALPPPLSADFGEVLPHPDAIRAASWPAYLLSRAELSLASAPWLREDMTDLDAIVARLVARIHALQPQRRVLAHGDYFPGNVLMSDDLRVSGVIDFGPLTLAGAQSLDLAGAAVFLRAVRKGYRPEDALFVRDRMVARSGPDVADAMLTYGCWYGLRFAQSRDNDPRLYAWCLHAIGSLRE